MPSTLSTQTRARLAHMPAPMSANWTSLPFDQIRSVGDSLLANNDIDAYMAFRAVCKDWRSATKDDDTKKKAGQDTDLASLLIPTKWVLLDRWDGDLVTLVHVDTGRFLCKRIPLLRKFFFVGATSGGLILLGESEEPHRARVLNPFTGSVAQFKVRIPWSGVRAVAMITKPSLTVFISTETDEIMWADQSMSSFKHFGMAYRNNPACITSFDGNLYAIDRYGSIYVSTVPADGITATARDITMEAISPALDTAADRTRMSSRYYLVESAGDLLLVTKPLVFDFDQPVVRRVNVETRVIEPVSSIGNRALFVSHVRCLSINTDKFPSIQGDCVYFLPNITGTYFGFVDRSIVRVADNAFVELAGGWGYLKGFFHPFTLTQVITDYCSSINYTELYEMMRIDWGWDISSDESESDESSSSELDDEELSSSEHDDEASSSEPVDD